MFRKALSVVIIVAVALALCATLSTGKAAPSAKEATDFEGKILYYRGKTEDSGTFLEKVHVKQLGGRAFLVGKYIKSYAEDEDGPEVMVWTPIDDLRGFAVFNNIDDARKAAAAASKKGGR
jgi:hypothetical protein